MGLQNRIAHYRAYKNGVSHCTFNPEGPGVLRIHLIPPKFRLFRSSAYIVILNGYYLLPLGYSWALILSNFIKEVNKFDGQPITEADEEQIAAQTVHAVQKVYPTVPKKDIEEDLEELLDVLFAVARGNDPQVQIEKLSIRAYRNNMTAPHRMDLMVSAMTDERGKWQCNQKCIFCYAAGQDSVQVTLYSHDEKIHNTLVGSDHYSDTIQGIRNAVAAGLDISINTPLCKKNADYEKTLAFIHSMGVRFVTVSSLICTGMAGINHEEYDLSSGALFEIVKPAKAFCNAHEMEMDFTSPGLIDAEQLEALGMNVPMCGAFTYD